MTTFTPLYSSKIHRERMRLSPTLFLEVESCIKSTDREEVAERKVSDILAEKYLQS